MPDTYFVNAKETQVSKGKEMLSSLQFTKKGYSQYSRYRQALGVILLL
jgi:hypothetical protein